MVTATQIGNCTDKLALFLAMTGADGDRSLDSGEHWGEPIVAADPQPMFPPWDKWAKWFWYFWYTEVEPTGTYRICNLDTSGGIESVIDQQVTTAVNRLGTYLSISRDQNETDLAYARRLLQAKLAGEQQ